MSTAIEKSSSASLNTIDRFAMLRAAVGHDLLALAVLHHVELDGETIARLQAQDENSGGFLLMPASERGKEALRLFKEGIRLIDEHPDDAVLDELAADYAAIYLTHAFSASPCESVWIDEEGLAMQEPMFQIREAYERHGLAVSDWRIRSDDHLVPQLQFLSHLFEKKVDLEEVARFLDEHLLRWIDRFAQRVGTRCATPFYAGLAMMTAAYLDELRDLLAEIDGQSRPSKEEIDRRMKPTIEVALPEPKFVPGSAPSW